MSVQKSGQTNDALRAAVEIAEKIQERITSGLLRAGSILPSERLIAESLDASRFTVREAIGILTDRGYLSKQAGKGLRVNDPKFGNARESRDVLVDWLGRKDASYLKMIELRRMFEPSVAELAALNATPANAASLLEYSQLLGTCDQEDLAETDAAFHQEIANLTGNDLIIELLSVCLEMTKPMYVQTINKPGGREAASRGHTSIALAIAAGEPEEARRAMLNHMTDAMDFID